MSDCWGNTDACTCNIIRFSSMDPRCLTCSLQVMEQKQTGTVLLTCETYIKDFLIYKVCQHFALRSIMFLSYVNDASTDEVM